MRLFKLLETQYIYFTDSVKNYLSKILDSDKYKTTLSNNTIFGQIINVVNAVVQNIMLYIEDALVEQNKYTAQRKKSIYSLASLSGYEPSTGKATGVQLILSFKPSNEVPFNIILNNHTKLLCSQNGLTYNIILPQKATLISLDKELQKYLYAVQGEFETQTFVSTGGKYYSVHLQYSNNIDLDYITLKVNNEVWEKVDSLYDMSSLGKQYVIKPGYNGGLDFIFGNNVLGQALNDGDVINIEYLIHDGELGNLDNLQNSIFIFDDNLYNIYNDSVDGNNLFNVSLVSNLAITSGTNSETTENVKNMIGYNSRSLVLASPENYKSFINKFSFCGYNRTWSEPGSLLVNSLIIKNYKQHIIQGKDYFNLSESDFYLTDMQKSSIINNIEKSGNQLAGVVYNIYNPDLCKYALYLYIKLKHKSVDTGYIENQIRDLIGDFFSNIQNDQFIPKSDITYLIKTNIPEIDGVTAYFISEKNETALKTHQYVDVDYNFNPAAGKYDKKETIKYLYDKENPNLGLDAHNNILLESNNQFPVLMGGWSFAHDNISINKYDNQEVTITDPLIINFE